MSHIYKISNDINNKIYIGYTSRNKIQDRFKEHCRDALYNLNQDNSILHKAMYKYGIKHFYIESLYEFNEQIEDWEKLEKFYIDKYNSLTPNGYNIAPGGNKPPIHYGDTNFKIKYPDSELPKLYNMLKNTSISYREISESTGLSIEYLYLINKGKYRYNPDIDYPIRKYSKYEEQALQIIYILSTDKTLSNRKIAKKFGIRPNEIASINNGKKYKYLWDNSFPIRKERVPDDYEEKQQIAKQVLEYKQQHPKATNIEIQQKCKVSRFVYEKIIKQIYPYNINI